MPLAVWALQRLMVSSQQSTCGSVTPGAALHCTALHWANIPVGAEGSRVTPGLVAASGERGRHSLLACWWF
jgi:hypothetical protein